MLVLDASLTVAWGFEDEPGSLAHGVLDRLEGESAAVPPIWPFEVANGVLVGERRQHWSPADVAGFFALLTTLPIEIEAGGGSAPALAPVLALAREHRLSVYDASYLELALRRGLPLATLDRRLQDAATRLGVSLVASG